MEGSQPTKTPGTELLIDETHGHLQHIRKGNGQILLIPQPSLTDRNDPLRWSTFKKWLVLSIGLAYSFCGSIIGPAMSGGMVQQADFFKISITKLSWAAGIYLLFSGVSTALLMPLSVVYGRRPALLLSCLSLSLACVWCGVASKTEYWSFFGGRLFAGLCAGPVEALLPQTITDIFFLHDRGEKIAIYGLSLLGGYEIGPVLSAYIIQYLGMDWAFYVVAIALGVVFIAIALFMPETAYHGDRPTIHMTAPQPGEKQSSPASIAIDAKAVPTRETKMGAVAGVATTSNSGTESEPGLVETPPSSYLQSLKFWSAATMDPHLTVKQALLRPFVLCVYPTVLWASFTFGIALTWNIVLALTVAQLFAPPPYAFDSAGLGLIFLSPFVGSLAGTYLCGPLGDRIALYYTRKNNGIREPEMRLVVVWIAAVLTLLGVMIAGPAYHYKTHWIGPVIGFGVLSAGAQIGCNISMTYALDCHKELAGEVMITISVVKSIFAWAWSWFINDWIILNGMMTVYFIVAAINLVMYATTIILYYKGKEMRFWIQQKGFLRRCGLD